MVRAFFEDERVLAFFTDRKGGFSKPPYDTLNVSFNVGDDIRSVIKNRQYIADSEDFLLDNLVFMKQVHSNRVSKVENSFINEIKDTDGLITNRRKIALMAMSADCAGVLMYDKKKGVVAALHSGREGTYQNISKVAIESFVRDYGCDIDDICVHVGASIGVCCYEIGEDLACETIRRFGKKYIQNKEDRYFLDLKGMIKDELLQEGIKEENIQVSQICTCCDRDYFSYRRDGKTGRFCALIMLK